MTHKKYLLSSLPILFATSMVGAHLDTTPQSTPPAKTRPVLADAFLLKEAKLTALAIHDETHVAYAELSDSDMAKLSAKAHEHGRCGGFEALPYANLAPQHLLLHRAFEQLSAQEAKNKRFIPSSLVFSTVEPDPRIATALSLVSEQNLRSTVEWLSSHPTRFHRSPTANDAVTNLRSYIEDSVLKGSGHHYQIDFIDHRSTAQKSLRVRMLGSHYPNEVIVIGAHLDSINSSFWGTEEAPGADDNASGSSNVLEALRVLNQQSPPQRTIEFFWYAGEEGGLLGSSEIARQYRQANADVIAVLQLDMTLHPGDGEFTLGTMTDFTSSWLRSYLEVLNTHYVKARIVEDRCGYGCSDHASWHRQGYPALMPFEATMRNMNRLLHTKNDLINENSNFRHSAMFSRIAVALAMDLGNSRLRESQ